MKEILWELTDVMKGPESCSNDVQKNLSRASGGHLVKLTLRI